MYTGCCPEPDQLEAFSKGKLDDDQLTSVGAHLDDCERCSADVVKWIESGDSFFDRLNNSDLHAADGELGRIIGVGDRPPTPADHRHSDEGPTGFPDCAGRYQNKGLLGKGNFGRVYRAYDTELDRPVALKVPHKNRLVSAGAVDRFLAEARAAARLDHQGIVKVYDVRRETGTVVAVLEYVEGRTLKSALKSERFAAEQVAGLIAEIADAVHFANEAGVVHRDLKPANILLDVENRPRVADFGLAVRLDTKHLRRGEIAGSPSYMAPESVRGETHRLDARTDLWSLGVILYEMLTGARPFVAETRSRLYEEIEWRNLKPLRETAPNVPGELERICLKCLSKRMADRYSSLAELAADLRRWQKDDSVAPPPRPTVMPKGLRCFDEHDADFYLDLLPGPRDREGLPETIRFWKTRIESREADQTFAVGLLYGPSGCGKTSLVRAGLLPKLGDHVRPVYVESTPEDVERKLLSGILRKFPELPQEMSLPEIISLLRETGVARGAKLLLVLDQFEQFLHGGDESAHRRLTDALRQCDGGRVQCLIMVRDDFWMAATRFFRSIEVRLVEDRNSAAVDLFGIDHGREVLAAFGRAFDRLPEDAASLRAEHVAFLKQAVAGLAENDKVICVRLALFAQMMKSKNWTPATLKQVGGTLGVGVTFLEETFGASTANPAHRMHQPAARAVLSALLPETGDNIKGAARSREELRIASGYSDRSDKFDDLINLLDTDIRLITPTVSTTDSEHDTDARAAESRREYQLTHDYLVPSLGDWLTQKQKETRRGRAELRLVERVSLWSAKPEKQRLPTLWEWVGIEALTRRKRWTGTQREMMKACRRLFLSRAAVTVALLIMFGGFGWWFLQQQPTPTRPPSPLLITVEIETVPPKVTVWITPINFAEGRYSEEDAIRVVSDSGTVKLSPGWYRVECQVPGIGIQEVWREVPESVDQRKVKSYRCTNWDRIDSERIRWASIHIKKIENSRGTLRLGHESLVRVDGGTFRTPDLSGISQSYRNRLPKTGMTVPGFLLGAEEVKLGNYRDVMRELATGVSDNDSPVTSVTFLSALEYCERVGARLPTLEEYLMAATDGGRNETPWGRPLKEQSYWEYDPEKARTFDRTPAEPPIYSLFSSVAEWTSSLYFPVDRKSGRNDTWPASIMEAAIQGRVIVGGGLEVAEKHAKPAALRHGPWRFSTVRFSRSDLKGLGFRVARSSTMVTVKARQSGNP